MHFKHITLVALLVITPALFSARNIPNNPTTTNSSPTNTAPAPKYVDPVDGYMTLYDTNHDGRLDKDELKKMAIFDATAYAQAQAFVDKQGNLGIDELAAWRAFLKQKWLQDQQTKGSGA